MAFDHAALDRIVVGAIVDQIPGAIGDLASVLAVGALPQAIDELQLEAPQLVRRVPRLEAVDIVLRDVDRGLIDFPAVRGGAEVYLCWLLDEDEIGYWHEPDAGFPGRRPL